MPENFVNLFIPFQLREIIGSHSISCAENLFIMYFDKGKTFTWKFNVSSSVSDHLHRHYYYFINGRLEPLFEV